MTANKSMISAAFILGIITCVATVFMTVYIPFITGGLGLVCAILSRDRSGAMDSRARTGAILSVIGLVVNVFVISYSVYSVFNDPQLFEQFNQLFKRMYGQDFNTYLNSYSLTLPKA